jgi:hypothetical protein
LLGWSTFAILANRVSAVREDSPRRRQPGPDRVRKLASLLRLRDSVFKECCELLLKGAPVPRGASFQSGDGLRREVANQDVRHADSETGL